MFVFREPTANPLASHSIKWKIKKITGSEAHILDYILDYPRTKFPGHELSRPWIAYTRAPTRKRYVLH